MPDTWDRWVAHSRYSLQGCLVVYLTKYPTQSNAQGGLGHTLAVVCQKVHTYACINLAVHLEVGQFDQPTLCYVGVRVAVRASTVVRSFAT